MVRHPRPADDARLSYNQIRRPPRPTKKARGRVTPGLQGLCPEGFGVTVAEGSRPAPGAENLPGPSPASDYHRSSPDCVSSCPLLRPPGAEISPSCSASPSRTSSRRRHPAKGSRKRENFLEELHGEIFISNAMLRSNETASASKLHDDHDEAPDADYAVDLEERRLRRRTERPLRYANTATPRCPQP